MDVNKIRKILNESNLFTFPMSHSGNNLKLSTIKIIEKNASAKNLGVLNGSYEFIGLKLTDIKTIPVMKKFSITFVLIWLFTFLL